MKLKSYLGFLLFSLSILVLSIYSFNNVSLPKFPQPKETIVIKTDALVQIEPDKMQPALVKKVIDGDTVELNDGRKVRYVGIDTPETKHPTKGVECFGKEASKQNRMLVEGKIVYLAKDVSEKDRYNRLLRYVYLPTPNATGEALFVNRYLVEEGYAHTLTYPPDVKFDQLFRKAEQTARENSKGLWRKCK